MITGDLGDVLGSPVWTVLATLLAAAAIWVSIWLYRRQRSRRSLSYSIKVTELVSVHDAAKDRIKLFYENEQISRAHLLEARIENDGNVPVPAGDFERDILFDLGKEAAPLTLEVSRTTPSDLNVPVFITNSAVGVSPLLLNPGDGFTIKALVRDLTSNEVQCHYRIVGVSEMVDAAAQQKSQRAILARILDNAFGAAVLSTLAVLAVVTLGSSVSRIFDSGNDEHPTILRQYTLIKLKDGSKICGEIVHFGFRLLVASPQTGQIKSVPRREIRSFRRSNC